MSPCVHSSVWRARLLAGTTTLGGGGGVYHSDSSILIRIGEIEVVVDETEAVKAFTRGDETAQSERAERSSRILLEVILLYWKEWKESV